MKHLLINNKLSLSMGLLVLMAILFVSSIVIAGELDDIHEDIVSNYDVQHISNEAFNNIPSENMVIFDVRKLKEYKVSHIENAIHLDPSTTAEEFFKQHASKLNNKVAVFYCSVGLRSSKMLSELKDKLPENGVSQAYNLVGGAFKWHNDQIDFVKNGEVTRDIHPYNAYWGRLVDDKESIKYK